MTTKKIISQLATVLYPYRVKLGIAMVSMIVVAGFNAAQAYMVKPLLDEIFVNKEKTLLQLLPLVLVGVFLVKGIFYFIYSYLLEWIGQSVIRNLRNTLYNHINTLSLNFYYQHTTGELISRIMNDVSMLQGAVSHALIRLLRDLFSVIGLLGVVFYMDWRLALIALVFLPMAAVPIVVFGKKFRRISTQYQRQMALSTNQLNETISGTRIVKAFCMEKTEVERFASSMKKLFEILMSETKYKCLSHPVVELMGGVGMALIIWFGGMQVLEGQSTPGTFMSFLAALFMLYEPVKGVSKINSTIQAGMASATRIFTLLDIKPDIYDKESAEDLKSFEHSIQFSGVSFSYEYDEHVLKEINLTVNKGEVIAVVGPSGSGKSTLVNLIPRFYDVGSGKILIDGVDISEVTMQSLRKQIALVTQQTILFNDTVSYNIGYGSETCSKKDIQAAAEQAYASEFIGELPLQFETVVGESGTRLSGGQQQRISIARALLKDAPILILDEATSSLDTESERKVQKALENLMENKTTIVIAHRLSTIKNADRIIVLKNGSIVECGTHDELIAQQGEYKSLYELQYAE